jgi:hypothetical protein
MMVKVDLLSDLGHEHSPSENEDVARLRLQLNGQSCEQLEKKGLVSYDQEEDIVRKGPCFEEDRPPLPNE